MRYINSVDIIRKLARTSKFQTIYGNAKEIGLKLFKNNCDYTDLQIIFLNFLNFYSTIYFDMALGEIDEIVLDNEIYEDSYMFWRKKSRTEKQDNSHGHDRYNKSKQPGTKTSTWVFKTAPKGVQ